MNHNDVLGADDDLATGGQPPGRSLMLAGHVPALDGLRGIAILLVMLLHFTPPGTGSSVAGAWMRSLADFGGSGVDLFFVLSGFLITGILLDTRSASHFFGAFYARRALRIFPLYFGTLTIVFLAAALLKPALSPGQARIVREQSWFWCYASNFREAALGGDWTFSVGWMQLSHFWSLAVEEHFYLLWPLLVFFLTRRQMAAACAAMIAAALVLRALLYWRGDPTLAFYTLTPCRMDGLAMGALLALAGRSGRIGHRLASWAWPGAILSGLMLFIIWRTELRAFVLGNTLQAILFASLLTLILTVGPRHVLRRFTSLGLLRRVGLYSYAMYVVHPFLLAGLTAIAPPQRLGQMLHSPPLGVALFMLMGFATTFVAGWLSWHLYEKHFLKLKRFAHHNPQHAAGTQLVAA